MRLHTSNIERVIMSLLDGPVEFETPEEFYDEEEEFEDEEEEEEDLDQLDDEAQAMIDSWDRTKLLAEVKEERDRRLARELEKDVDHYDGQPFSDIRAKMQPLEGGKVFVRVTKKNPKGGQISGSHTILFDKIGYLESNEIPFESSVYDGRPTKLNLIEGPILPGLLHGLIQLREGESAEILIHPAMAYGKLGCIPLIPEDSWILYFVTIHKIWEESHLESVVKFEKDHHVNIPIEQKVLLVEEHKRVANNFLKDGHLRDALIRYKAGIKCLEELPEARIGESSILTELLTTLLVNAAITLNRLEMPKSAGKMARRALFFKPNNLKAYYQLVKSRMTLGDYHKAADWLEKVYKLSPGNSNFSHLKVEIDSKLQPDRDKQEEILRKISKSFFANDKKE